MNRRVLILVNHDLVVYNFRKELVVKLIKEGFDVYIGSPNGDRITELIEMGCNFIEIPVDRHGKNPLKELALLSTYKSIIKKIQPLCVLTYTIKPNIFGAIAAKKYNVPCLANITGLGTAVEKKSFLQFITVSLYKYAFKRVNTVFFQNQENMCFFIDKKISKRDRYYLLPGSGVNLEEFSYLKYPENNQPIKFVFISRIMKEKGIDIYLETAKIIKNKGYNAEFHICGFCEEDYQSKLSDYEKKNIIIYHGMVTNIKEILENIHCTVHPSYYPEGLSNVLLESSASGRPIITTDRSGCKEVVGNGNGIIIRQNSLEDLVNAIETFISLDNNQMKNMGLLGRQFVAENFNRKIVVQTYLMKINKLLGEK